MNLLVGTVGNDVYNYNIEISTDKNEWAHILSAEKQKDWKNIKFNKQPVIFIKIAGTVSTAEHSRFDCIRLECFTEK
uniref:F5/8 type C domain-containing protein n=1 Tax=Panagrellus redivivus TaxID=6233 RepID=A0A7E4ZRC6_PANRE